MQTSHRKKTLITVRSRLLPERTAAVLPFRKANDGPDAQNWRSSSLIILTYHSHAWHSNIGDTQQLFDPIAEQECARGHWQLHWAGTTMQCLPLERQHAR